MKSEWRRVEVTLPLPADTCIEWSFPEPRAGWRGKVDRSFGPGALKRELQLFGAASLAAVLLLLGALKFGAFTVNWSGFQIAAALFFALNAGFITAITSGTCKRWYHRDKGVTGAALALVIVDGLFQLGLANVAFLWGDFRYFAYLGSYFVVGALIIPQVPLYLRRPAAYLAFMAAMLLSLYIVPRIAGLEWFPLVFFLKYFVAHIPREEPYRPTSAAARPAA